MSPVRVLAQLQVGRPDQVRALHVDEPVAEHVGAQQHLAVPPLEAAQVQLGAGQLQFAAVEHARSARPARTPRGRPPWPPARSPPAGQGRRPTGRSRPRTRPSDSPWLSVIGRLSRSMRWIVRPPRVAAGVSGCVAAILISVSPHIGAATCSMVNSRCERRVNRIVRVVGQDSGLGRSPGYCHGVRQSAGSARSEARRWRPCWVILPVPPRRSRPPLWAGSPGGA